LKKTKGWNIIKAENKSAEKIIVFYKLNLEALFLKIVYSRYFKRLALAAVSAVLIFALTAFLIKIHNPAQLVSTRLETTIVPCVVLDAGHGGFDGGATSVYGELEKDINLEIALKTETFLKLFGFRVVMTRTDGSALANTKKEDMYKRLEIIKSCPDSVFVSIHQNNFSQSKYFGAQMFYGSNNKEDSKALALLLQENFKTNLNAQNTRQAKSAPSDLFLFKKSPVPSVLIECGFLSNYDEARLLANSEYQKQIAFTIAQSVVQYYLNQNIERTYKNGSAEV